MNTVSCAQHFYVMKGITGTCLKETQQKYSFKIQDRRVSKALILQTPTLRSSNVELNKLWLTSKAQEQS